MRGGISYTVQRFSKANNKYMQLYDDKKPSCVYYITNILQILMQIIYMVRQ